MLNYFSYFNIVSATGFQALIIPALFAVALFFIYKYLQELNFKNHVFAYILGVVLYYFYFPGSTSSIAVIILILLLIFYISLFIKMLNFIGSENHPFDRIFSTLLLTVTLPLFGIIFALLINLSPNSLWHSSYLFEETDYSETEWAYFSSKEVVNTTDDLIADSVPDSLKCITSYFLIGKLLDSDSANIDDKMLIASIPVSDYLNYLKHNNPESPDYELWNSIYKFLSDSGDNSNSAIEELRVYYLLKHNHYSTDDLIKSFHVFDGDLYQAIASYLAVKDNYNLITNDPFFHNTQPDYQHILKVRLKNSKPALYLSELNNVKLAYSVDYYDAELKKILLKRIHEIIGNIINKKIQKIPACTTHHYVYSLTLYTLNIVFYLLMILPFFSKKKNKENTTDKPEINN